MAKIGIVICNYNKQNDVIDCIQSVLESKYEDYHIYVVDNASTDESVRLIRECYGSCDRLTDRKSTRLNSSHQPQSRMPSSA